MAVLIFNLARIAGCTASGSIQPTRSSLCFWQVRCYSRGLSKLTSSQTDFSQKSCWVDCSADKFDQMNCLKLVRICANSRVLLRRCQISFFDWSVFLLGFWYMFFGLSPPFFLGSYRILKFDDVLARLWGVYCVSVWMIYIDGVPTARLIDASTWTISVVRKSFNGEIVINDAIV